VVDDCEADPACDGVTTGDKATTWLKVCVCEAPKLEAWLGMSVGLTDRVCELASVDSWLSEELREKLAELVLRGDWLSDCVPDSVPVLVDVLEIII
jgi:hypothetical protein